jgi:integrase
MFYLAMRIAMDSGMRVGSIKKLRWQDIDKNSALPVEMQKKWCSIDVPRENTKTGNAYRCAAPIVKHINNLKKVVRRDLIKGNNLIFVNQMTGKPWSIRIWEDYLKEVLVEARIANWAEDSQRGKKGLKIKIISGKNLTFYSFRHTHITWRLKEGTPMAIVAKNTNTSMQYIEKHYFHYQADEAVAQLAKGREKYIKPTLASTEWIRAFQVDDYA